MGLMMIFVFNINAQRNVSPAGLDAGDCVAPCATLAYAISQSNPGDVINVADGTYPVSATTIVDKALSIVGASEAGTIVELMSGTPLLSVTAAGVSLSTLTLRVNPAHPTPNANTLVDPASNFSATNVTFQNAGDYGVTCNVDVVNLSFIDCSFLQNEIAFRTASTASADNVDFIRCIFEGRTTSPAGTYGIYNSNETVATALLSNLLVDSCSFSNYAATSYSIGIYLENAEDVVIRRSQFVNGNYGIAFTMFTRGQGDLMDNIVIDSNTFANNTLAGIAMFAQTNQGYSNVTMNCNTFSDNLRNGIRISGASATFTNININNNSFISNDTSAIRVGLLSNAQVINAENNYYGTANGPTHPMNPGGTGDIIDGAGSVGSVSIDFMPFLTTRACAGELPIPTLGEWGLIILILSMSAFAIIAIRQRKPSLSKS